MDKFIEFVKNNENDIMENFQLSVKQLDYYKSITLSNDIHKSFIHNMSKVIINNFQYGPKDLYKSLRYSVDEKEFDFLLEEMYQYIQKGFNLSQVIEIINYYKYAYINVLRTWSVEEEYKNLCLNYIMVNFDYIQFKVSDRWCNINETEKTERIKDWNSKITDEKNKYLSIFESIPNPVIILDNENRINNINESAIQLSKNNNFNIYSENIREREKFLWIKDELKYFCAGNYSEISFVKECKLYNDNLFFKVKLKKIKINNDFIGTIVILDDISHSRKISEELENSEKNLREITDNMRDLICKIDVNGTIQYLSPSVKHVLGYSSKDLMGKSIFSGIHSEDLDKVMSLFNRNLIDETTNIQEVRYRKQNGYYAWIEIMYNLLYGEDGNSVGAIIVGRDITERKESEVELQKSKVLLESANLIKSEFLANMSNEIRKPLNSIIDMIDIILSTNTLDEEQNEYMNIVKESSSSLFKIINNILDFSKMKSGKMRLEEVEFNIRDIINETVDALAIRAHEKKLEFMIYMYPDVDENLIGDPWKFKKIFINIVGNAIKFTERGEVVIYVEKIKDQLDKITLKISVIDTGIGMSEDKINKMSKDFNQMDTYNGKKCGAIGLGLSISKQLLELMDGNIWFESKCKKGSSFYFTLDFKLQQYKQEIINYNYLKNLNVLLIDDNKTNRTIVYNMLTNLEINVRFVATAEEGFTIAKEYARRNRYFDAIIIDEIMPGMDGFVLSTRLKKEINISNPIIMMLSNVESNKSKNRCKQIGVYDYLVKPVNQLELYNVIKDALNIEERYKSEEYDSHNKFFNEIKDNINKDCKQKINALIAEDNMVNQKFISTLIKKRNWNVFYASNGKEVLNMLENKKIDLMIMDIEMPEMNAIETIKKMIKKEQEGIINDHIPVIVMGSEEMEHAREKYIELGIEDYLLKPIVATDMNLKIDQIMKNNKSKGEEQLILDLDQAIDTTGGDEQLFKELIQIFLQSYAGQIKDIKEAIEENDSRGLEVKSNNLKEIAGSLGANSIFSLASELEKMGKDNNMENAKKTFERVQLETIRFKSVLNKIQSKK